MKLLIAGTGRDIEKYWENTKKSLDIIFSSIDDYRCVFVESNSSDNTLNCMKEWANKDSRRIILTLGQLSDISRTVRISKCRNTYLDYFKSNNLYDEFDYLLVIDIDDILNIEPNFKDQLESCFHNLDWDGISSNRNDIYYDIWALRSNSDILNCNYDCHFENYEKRIITSKYNNQRIIRNLVIKKDFKHLLKNIPRDYGFIDCNSAFGGMTLYKTKMIKNRNYDGSTTCEHISFHTGLKMVINSKFISG